MAETFEAFYRRMNIQQPIKSYSHQSSGQVEACIQFVKPTSKRCFDTNRHKFSFISDSLNTNRNKPPMPCNDAVEQANKGPVASNE